MRRGGAMAVGLLATLVGLSFLALIVVPWLAFAGKLTIPGLDFARPGASLSVADVASVTVAGATGLLAVTTALLAFATRRAVVEARRSAKTAEDVLRSYLEAAQQQVSVGKDQVEASNRQAALAKDAFEASFRPLMAEVPRGFRSYPDAGRSIEVVRDHFERIEDESEVVAGADYGKPGFYSVALRNVGAGPAVVTEVKDR